MSVVTLVGAKPCLRSKLRISLTTADIVVVDAARRRVHERHITRLDGIEPGCEMVGRYALHHEAGRSLVIDRSR